jgi:hypothetical protein
MKNKDYKIKQKLKRAKLNEGIRQDDLIDKYLMGQMTKDEEIAFFAELEMNPEFKHNAVMTAWLVKGIKSLGNKLNK